MNSLTFSLSEINTAAEWLIKHGRGYSVWLFDGAMGAGKTTIIGALCQQMGVQGATQSPTFSIVNEYVTVQGTVIYHFDCYRLKNSTEAYDIGVEEYLDSGHYCFVEWPEKIEDLLPNHTLTVMIEPIDQYNRKVSLRKSEKP